MLKNINLQVSLIYTYSPAQDNIKNSQRRCLPDVCIRTPKCTCKIRNGF